MARCGFKRILLLISVFLDLLFWLRNYNKWSRDKIYENGNISIVGPIQQIDILEKYKTRGFKGQMWIQHNLSIISVFLDIIFSLMWI